MSPTVEPERVDGSTQKFEDYPLSAVPLSARRSIWSLAPILIGFTFSYSPLIAGGQIGPAFRFFPDLILLIVIGNIVRGAYCAALGYIAQKSGLATVLMARFSFGNVGSRWVDFILGTTQIGWYAVTNAFLAEALNKLIGIPASFNWLVMLIFTYAFCTTAYFGYKAMDWLSRMVVPPILVLLAISLAIAMQDSGSFAQIEAIQPKESLSFAAGLTVVISTFISGGSQATNWSRFADTSRNAVNSTLLAFLVMLSILLSTGAFWTLVYGTKDITQVMTQQGLLFWWLVLLIPRIWTTQDKTIYAFSMAGSNFFRTSKRTLFVLGGATFAYFLSLRGIYSQVIPYLIFLGSVIPPVGSIIMVDFWLKHRGQFPDINTPIPAFNWAGIIAYVVAAVTAFISGQIALGVPPINGIIVAAVLYGILVKVMPMQQSEVGSEN